MKINLVGNIFGTSGYSVHSRNFFNALVKQNKDTFLATGVTPTWLAEVNDNELKCIKGKWFNDGVNYMIGMPNHWQQIMNLPGSEFVGCCVWEGDKVPKGFIKPLKKANKVIVPSKHTYDAVINTEKSIKDKLYIVPHGVDPEHFKPQAKSSDKFVFLANKGWASGDKDRGGVQFLIKAYCEEFKPEDKVELRLKINTAYCPPGWNLQAEIEKLNLPPKEQRPLILISTESIEYKHLPNFYSGDCFISPTMGEAFSLPCAEALACEIPVITTGFGGQTDFVNEKNGWLVDYDLIENQWDFNYEGIKWAVPKLQDLRAKMRYAFENKEECVKKGKAGRKYVIENLTWDIAAKKFLEIFDSNTTDSGVYYEKEVN